MNRQFSFNPVDFCFSWTADNWYEWDGEKARKEAMAARSAKAKDLQAQGLKVRKSSLSGQLITRGGIGTTHPEISHFVTVFKLDVVG